MFTKWRSFTLLALMNDKLRNGHPFYTEARASSLMAPLLHVHVASKSIHAANHHNHLTAFTLLPKLGRIIPKPGYRSTLDLKSRQGQVSGDHPVGKQWKKASNHRVSSLCPQDLCHCVTRNISTRCWVLFVLHIS